MNVTYIKKCGGRNIALISIVTITFNNYDELISTLNSINNLNNIESIVINGGSCLKTKEFLDQRPGVSLSEKDDGISDAFNKAIKLAKGDAIMFLNSGDILIDKSYIDQCNILISKDPTINYFYSDIIFKDDVLGPIKVKFGHEMRPLAKGMPYPHQTLIVRKDVFEAIGYFDTNLKIAMDFDFLIRMLNEGYTRFKYLPIASVEMDGSGISSRQELDCIHETRQVLANYRKLNFFSTLRLNISILLFYFKKNKSILYLTKKFRHSVRF